MRGNEIAEHVEFQPKRAAFSIPMGGNEATGFDLGAASGERLQRLALTMIAAGTGARITVAGAAPASGTRGGP